MNRRYALGNVALLMGGAISATTLSVMCESCKQPSKKMCLLQMAPLWCQNRSPTYMALTARACDYAVKEMKKMNL